MSPIDHTPHTSISKATSLGYKNRPELKGASVEPKGCVIVEFDGLDDSDNPQNWSLARKSLSTLLFGLTTMSSTFATASYSTGSDEIMGEFGVPNEVAALGTTFILFGLGLGPLLWAPLSELYGRRLPTLVPFVAATCFVFGTGTAKDIQTILITRFMVGFFGSAPPCITGGALADMFDVEQRAVALTAYAMAVIGGPVFGPIVGGAIVQGGNGWRWTQYTTGIIMASVAIFDACFLQESYHPVILTGKARRKRLQSGDWAWHARHEEWDPTLQEMARKYLVRPIQLLSTPLCFFGAMHASFVYAIVYLNLGSFPIVFEQDRGWNHIVGKLPFLGLFAGALIGAYVNVLSNKWFLSRLKASGRSAPEDRLPPMIIGAVGTTAGLFLLGNTTASSWAWPVVAAVLMGFGFFTIFQSIMNYQIDTFPRWAASAVAANTCLRGIMAGCFPPLVKRLYGALGIKWASNLLGFVALAMLPIPCLLFFFGRSLRAKGKWSRSGQS